MSLPADYVERVYAGVLGKIIGVYLGRPFEGWGYERIVQELGEVWYYVHEKLNKPLVVTDDDISGTFTFVRALEDYGNSPNLTAQQIGQSWLNYIIENKTILWWGGMGTSTEHTAFLRLKQGVAAPQSGSMELNSRIVAEQIGAQIFIDGWAMVAPGNPRLAVELAKKAGSVSHDGEALYGAMVVAAIESLVFVEQDWDKLLDSALEFIPADSVIARMIGELRQLRRKENDWRQAYQFLKANYGYDKFGGGCHMVPNHGVIVASLLWGDDDFQKSLMIANTCGWDTDCNSGNVGCILGIKKGLQGIESGPDWRGPVADRILLPTADGGSCITDAVQQTYKLVNMGRALAGEKPLSPKDGARFHFSLPGSVQGFAVEDSPECRGTATLQNPRGDSLEIHYYGLAPGRPCRVATPTFVSPEQAKMGGYGVFACPTLYPGQTVRVSLLPARILVGPGSVRGIAHEVVRGVEVERKLKQPPTPISARLYIRTYGDNDQLTRIYGPEIKTRFDPSEVNNTRSFPPDAFWQIPDTGGHPIVEAGIELQSDVRADGVANLAYLTWSGEPDVTFRKPDGGGTMWQRAWVDGMHPRLNFDNFCQNEGRGLGIHGTRDWKDYRLSATITPHLSKAIGIAARVQGMQRYYALLLCNDGSANLVKMLDGERVLASKPFAWQYATSYPMALEVKGQRIKGWLGEELLFELTDDEHPLESGAIAIVCEEGRGRTGPVKVEGVE